jgi:hypothetical protein
MASSWLNTKERKEMGLDFRLVNQEYVDETVVCEVCQVSHIHTACKQDIVFDENLTSNLETMAEAAGIHDAMWAPEKLNATKASDITEILKKGLKDLTNKDRIPYFRKFNPPSGWGSYEDLVEFVKDLLKACINNPDAHIEV